jgi:rSAM/selenodomain-associated transferase 1
MNGGLAIFVKTPGLSPIKTRLAATRSRAFAEHWHRLGAASVATVVQKFAERSEWTAYWAVAERQGIGSWSGFASLLQPNGGLGQRMAGIHRQLLDRHGRAILIGADSPQLTAAHLHAAERALAGGAEHVLGPADDGGFWLLGSRKPIDSAIWESVPYSREDTCARLQAALAETTRCPLIDRLRDVDQNDDLAPVLSALQALRSPTEAQRALAAWMRSVLEPERSS